MAYIPPKKAMMNLDINAPTSGGFESVGQSLLAQKRVDESRAAKRTNRNNMLMKGLGLLTLGSKLYRGASEKRGKELEASQAFSLGNTKSRVNAMKTIASIQQMTRNKGYDEIIADPSIFDNTKTALRPLITEQMKARFNEQRYDELPATIVDSLESRATKNILEELLKADEATGVSRLQSVSDRMFGGEGFAGSALLEGRTPEDKIAYAFNLTPEAFDGSQKRLYAAKLAELQDKDGIFSIDNFLNGLDNLGIGKGRKGSINIFKSMRKEDVEDAVLGEGTVQMMLDAAKIQTDIIPIIQDAIVANVSEDYSSAITANRENLDTTEGMAVDAIRKAVINESDIDDGVYNSPHLGEFVSALAISDDMEEIFQEMEETIFNENTGTVSDKPQSQPLTDDAATFYLILSEAKEQKFAEQLYMSSAHTEALRQNLEAGTDVYEKYVRNRVKEFAIKIRKPAYAEQRAKFSLLTALRAGAVEKYGEGIGGAIRQTFTDFSLDGYTYDSNKVKALLKPALDFEDGGYSRGSGWQYLNDRQKKNILFLEVDEIQQSGATTAQKEDLLKSLIANIAERQFGSVEEFVQGYEKWKPLWEKQASHFQLYGELSNGKEFDPDFNPNGAAQLQQRLFGSNIDKHFGWGISKGQYGQRSKYKDISNSNIFEKMQDNIDRRSRESSGSVTKIY